MTYTAALVGLSGIAADPGEPTSDPVLGGAVPNSHTSAMAAIPMLRVVAACDVSLPARDRFVERWSPTWPDLKVYADYREMLERERPEVLSVATPDDVHVEPVLAAIASGTRMIFCEKPLATSLDAADRVVEAAQRSGTTISVNYSRRWIPDFVEARRLVRSGAIGRLSQIVIETGGPRAMLFRKHTHELDSLDYYAGSPADWVIADLEAGFEDYGTAYRGDGGREPGTEPGGNYYVAFENGVRGYVTGMKSSVDEVRIDLIGSDGRVTVDMEGLRLVIVSRPQPGAPREVRVQRVVAGWTTMGIEAALRDLIESHEQGRSSSSPPESARHTVALTEAILRSQAAGHVPVHVARAPAGTTAAPS
jgi:predicted dehydrogenase